MLGSHKSRFHVWGRCVRVLMLWILPFGFLFLTPSLSLEGLYDSGFHPRCLSRVRVLGILGKLSGSGALGLDAGL